MGWVEKRAWVTPMGQSLVMEVARAWDDEHAGGSWRRDRRVERIWLLLGIALLAVFLVIVTRQQDHADWLVSHGAQTRGVVLEDPPQAIRCGQVPVPIRFNDGVHTFFVDGCGGGGLSEGDLVRVSYNPGKPDDFTVNGNPNERPLPTFAAIVSLVVGAILVIGAFVLGRRLYRLRRILREHAWQPVTATVARYPSGWTRGRWVVRLGDASSELLTQSNGLRDLLRDDGAVEFAGDPDGPAVVRDVEVNRLVLAEQPRSRRSRARAARVITEHSG